MKPNLYYYSYLFCLPHIFAQTSSTSASLTEQQSTTTDTATSATTSNMGTPAFNGTILDNMNNHPNLRMLSLALRTYCGQVIQSELNNRTANFTFFAPTDEAISRGLFNISGIQSAADFNCPNIPGGNLTVLSNGCTESTLKNVSLLPFTESSPCLPLILQYHLVPNQRISPMNLNQSNANFTVTTLRTGLDDNRFVHLLPENSTDTATSTNSTNGQTNSTSLSQVLLLNQTTNGTFLLHGAWPPAHVLVNETITGINGIVYLIDSVLLPPLNLTNTLEVRNQTSQFSQSFNSTSMSSNNATLFQNITVFAPINTALSSNSTTSLLNNTSYIVPGMVLYNNYTDSTSLNVTNQAGKPMQIQFGGQAQNYSMTVNGVSVIESNILISEGVLHIINGTLSNGNATNAGTGSYLKTAKKGWLSLRQRPAKC